MPLKRTRLCPEHEDLRQQAHTLKSEAERAKEVAKRSLAEIVRAREAVTTFLASASIENKAVSNIERRLKAQKAKEGQRIGVRLLYMIAVITLAWGASIKSIAILSFSAVALFAPSAVDWLVGRFRILWVRRLSLKLAKARRIAIASDPALQQQLEALELAVETATESGKRASTVADSLEEAAKSCGKSVSK